MTTSIETVVGLLVVRLWKLVAVKVEAQLALQLGSVQQELLDAARGYRDQGTEWGNAVASSLEATSDRIAHDWSERSALHLDQSAPSSRPSRRSENSAENDAPSKRSRGRPRKDSHSELFANDVKPDSAVKSLGEEVST